MCDYIKKLTVLYALALAGVTAITNGNADLIDEPYQVLIYFIVEDIRPNCGGAVIGPKVVLTAGSCIPEFPWQVTVISGTSSRDQGSMNVVQHIERHPLFKESGDVVHNDIGVLITVNDVINAVPIDLGLENPLSNEQAYSIGWGSNTPNTYIFPKIVQYYNLTMISTNECNNLIKSSKLQITPNHLCGRPLRKGGNCYGDSGNPLIVRYKLIGVASKYLKDCGTDGMPSIFTSIVTYKHWINQVSLIKP